MKLPEWKKRLYDKALEKIVYSTPLLSEDKLATYHADGIEGAIWILSHLKKEEEKVDE